MNTDILNKLNKTEKWVIALALVLIGFCTGEIKQKFINVTKSSLVTRADSLYIVAREEQCLSDNLSTFVLTTRFQNDTCRQSLKTLANFLSASSTQHLDSAIYILHHQNNNDNEIQDLKGN